MPFDAVPHKRRLFECAASLLLCLLPSETNAHGEYITQADTNDYESVDMKCSSTGPYLGELLAGHVQAAAALSLDVRGLARSQQFCELQLPSAHTTTTNASTKARVPVPAREGVSVLL